MALIAMFLTLPLIFISYKKKFLDEKYFVFKILLLWLLCQLYITINDYFRLPVGIIIAIIIIYNEKINKLSKIIAFSMGCFSFLFSSTLYFILNL